MFSRKTKNELRILAQIHNIFLTHCDPYQFCEFCDLMKQCVPKSYIFTKADIREFETCTYLFTLV